MTSRLGSVAGALKENFTYHKVTTVKFFLIHTPFTIISLLGILALLYWKETITHCIPLYLIIPFEECVSDFLIF